MSVAAGGIGVAVVVALLSGCANSDRVDASGAADPAKEVRTEQVRRQMVRRTVDIVGTLAAVDQVTVSSEADGTVSRVLADLGDRVKAGQVLVLLDREKLQYNADQQKAALERALAKYGAAAPDRLPPIEETPEVQKAAAELFQAKQAFGRADELHRQQLVPRQTLDDADATRRSKQAEYDAALQDAKNLRADIAASVASMKLAERQLRDTEIRAPFDGYVEKRLVTIGQLVKAQTAVMDIVRVDPLKVTAEIPESMAPWIKVDQAATVSVDAYPDRPLAGKISRISPAVNTQTRAFPFEALVPNPDGRLKPGTFARVHLETDRVDQVLTIPYAAIQYRYGVNRAFVVRDGRLAARELKVGDRVGDRIVVTSGLTADEAVAVTDVDQLADGMKVRPASDGA
jgi:HlyD family secretion protein